MNMCETCMQGCTRPLLKGTLRWRLSSSAKHGSHESAQHTGRLCTCKKVALDELMIATCAREIECSSITMSETCVEGHQARSGPGWAKAL
eukprot:5393271-Pleurochrysis_carterae.AAC.3